MNQISHKQAVKWIHRRLDGLLTQKQLLLLDEHLHSCDSCSTYAAEMELLPARLQGEFHERWDEEQGPSQKVMEHVAMKARNIPMTKRISSGAKLFAGAAALLVLGFAINFVVSQLRDTSATTGTGTETVSGLTRPQDRLLAFSSDRNGNHDIYSMHADGSGLTNLTKHPAYEGSPFWSPDGRRIALVSDRSGSSQIYLMDPDGSNVTQLTSEAGDAHFDTNGHSAWSPDGRRLIFSYRSEGEKDWHLYSMDADGNNKTLLTHEPGVYLGPSWSPDGEHIAFAYYGSEARPLARRLFIVDKNGKNQTELTDALRIDQTRTFLGLDYYWSPDGTSVFFTAASTVAQETTYAVYEARLDGSLIDITEVKTGKFVIDWWDETLLQQEDNARTWTWIRSDGSRSALDICQNTDRALGIAYKRSEHGNVVFGADCSATGWQLYWANPDGSVINQLLNSGIPARNDVLFNMLWSPDDRFVAFVSLDSDAPNPTSTLYVLDVEQARTDPSTPPLKREASSDPSWQPVIRDSVVEQEPTPKPEQTSSQGRLLAFTSEQNGNIDIYTMDANGSELTNLTNNPAQDLNPFWSPDGSRIAFESDRLGSLQIYLMAPDGSGVIQLTQGEADHEIGTKYGMSSSPWSPDGGKLIFSQRPPTATVWTLHVMEANGENQQPLVSEPGVYSFPAWSPDGGQIAFLADDATNPAGPRLYVVNADGSDLIDVTESLPENESLWAYNGYYWSQDGGSGSIFFIAWRQAGEGQDRWIAYEFRPAANELIEKAVASTAMGDWWKGTSLLTGFADDRDAPITWLRSDGTSSTLKPFERCGPVDEYGFTYQRSARGDLMMAARCPGGDWWLYWANPDGTLIEQLLDAPIGVEEFSFSSMAWSPDDKYITFSITSNNLTELYLLDVEAALNDPAAQPVKVTTSARMPFYNSSWQPRQTTNAVDSSFDLRMDPQSCKPFSDPSFETPPASQLYGYEPIQGLSMVDGDFSYDFWLYCDPNLKPDKEKSLNTIAGLGIFSSWRYNGPHAEGPVEYRYEFDPAGYQLLVGGGDWNGPLDRSSITGATFGIDLPEVDIRTYIEQGTPVQLRATVDSPLGHRGAILSFKLEPTEQGLRVVDMRAEAEHLTSRDEQWIAFASTQNGNSEIYTMHTDGSGVTNLTDEPAEDVSPVWSPDGKRMAFISNRDGSDDIYVMNADGSDLIRLTDDPTTNAFPVWSPDSTKIAYASHDYEGNLSSIYVVEATGKNRQRLTENIPGPLLAWPEAWSPDGQSLFFHSNLQISKVSMNDGAITQVTSQEDVALQGSLSKDGSNLSFLDGCGPGATDEFCVQVKTIDPDGTGAEAHTTVELQDVCRAKEMIKWSPDRTKILLAFPCEEKGGWFYIANADGSGVRSLTSYPILYGGSGFDWSPDSQFIVFSSALGKAPLKTDSPYLLNVSDNLQSPHLNPILLNTSISQITSFAWQPIPGNEALAERPTPVGTQPSPQAENRLIAFTSGMEDGNLDIYTMHPDGSELTNLTRNSAHDVHPVWSPDGKRIAFESDRGGVSQIFLMNADGSDLFPVTDGQAQQQLPNSNPWSPDGSRLLFTEWAPENEQWMLYAIDAGGENETALAQVPNNYSSISWAPDGQHVAFLADDPQNLGGDRLYVVGADGQNRRELTKSLQVNEELSSPRYDWSADGRSIFFIGFLQKTNPSWTVYEARLDDNLLIEHETTNIPLQDWWKGVSVKGSFNDASALVWTHSRETISTLHPYENCQQFDAAKSGSYIKRSSNGTWLISAYCPNGEAWFYWVRSNGTLTRQLLDFPIASEQGVFSDLVWSPDDKFVAFNIFSKNLTEMYILDIEASLNDPATQPLKTTIGGGSLFFDPAWQPGP